MSFRDTVTINVKKSTSLLATAVALPLFLGFSAAAMATNGILPLGNGMTAHGFGGAGISNPGDAMAGADNPALVANTGDQMAVGLTLFAPYRSADIGAGYVASDKNLFPIPSFGWTKTLTPKMNMGVLVTAMGGMNTTYSSELLKPMLGPASDDFGIDLSGLIIAPTLSYAPNKSLSYGAALLLGYEKLTTTVPDAMTIPTTTIPIADGTDSATGSGVRVGFNIDFDDTTSMGAFYQSRIKMGEMSKHCDMGVFGLAKQAGIACEVNLAPITGVGFKINTSSNSKIVMDFLHVAWSKVELFKKAFGWNDQEVLKVGMEVRQTSSFTWRLGYNYAQQPLNQDSVIVNEGTIYQQAPGVMAPAVSEMHYTFGFSQKMGKNELVGYYAYVPEVEVTDPTSGARVKMYQHALGLGYNWK